MELHVTRGGFTAVFSGEPMEAFREAQAFAEIPDKCPVCGRPTKLRYRKITSSQKGSDGDEFEFVDVQCNGYPVRHSSTLGQHKPKEGGGLYYRQNVEKYPWQEYDFDTQTSRDVGKDEMTGKPSPRVQGAR